MIIHWRPIGCITSLWFEEKYVKIRGIKKHNDHCSENFKKNLCFPIGFLTIISWCPIEWARFSVSQPTSWDSHIKLNKKFRWNIKHHQISLGISTPTICFPYLEAQGNLRFIKRIMMDNDHSRVWHNDIIRWRQVCQMWKGQHHPFKQLVCW